MNIVLVPHLLDLLRLLVLEELWVFVANCLFKIYGYFPEQGKEEDFDDKFDVVDHNHESPNWKIHVPPLYFMPVELWENNEKH